MILIKSSKPKIRHLSNYLEKFRIDNTRNSKLHSSSVQSKPHRINPGDLQCWDPSSKAFHPFLPVKQATSILRHQTRSTWKAQLYPCSSRQDGTTGTDPSWNDKKKYHSRKGSGAVRQTGAPSLPTLWEKTNRRTVTTVTREQS